MEFLCLYEKRVGINVRENKSILLLWGLTFGKTQNKFYNVICPIMLQTIQMTISPIGLTVDKFYFFE